MASSDSGIRVGNAEVRRIEEIVVRRPLSALSDNLAIVQEEWHWLCPKHVDRDGTWDMVVQSWLLIVADHVIVVDPCVGNGRHFPDLPMFHSLNTPYMERFEATGFQPEDVDYVFCTHLHMDHCGWNTQLRDGRFVPTFPNARYVIVRRELERWDPRRPDYIPTPVNAGAFENSVLPVLEAGQADIVTDGHQILEGLRIEPAYGHTAGHCALHLRSANEEAYFTGDLFHHPLELVRPEINRHICEDFAATYATRKRLIGEFLERAALIVPAHFGSPYVGRIHRANGLVRYEPLESRDSFVTPTIAREAGRR